MNRAFELAKEALAVAEVPVGCVFQIDSECTTTEVNGRMSEVGRILGEGRNEVNESKNASRHAEMVAIDRLISLCHSEGRNVAETFRNCTLYVTVEPCIMCASALKQLGVKKIVFGCRNERFGGLGSVVNVFRSSDSQHIEVLEGIRKEEAIALLRKFYLRENPTAPQPRSKTARLFKDPTTSTTDSTDVRSFVFILFISALVFRLPLRYVGHNELLGTKKSDNFRSHL